MDRNGPANSAQPDPKAKPAANVGKMEPGGPVHTPTEAVEPTPPQAVEDLTAAEQMARYEDDLKEHDWGHQPC